VKNAIILAAGKSSRFGRNKLEEKFGGKTLPRLAAEWAYGNGAERIYLTLSRSAVKTDGADVFHPVLEDLHAGGIEPIVAFQPEDSYGPGAAISLWAPVIDGPVTCLFGDNAYDGYLNEDVVDLLEGDYEGAVFTTKRLDPNPRNLQLATVKDGYLIEKPHNELSGEYFCGFVRFPSGYLQSLGQLRKSERGEVEVTEMVNFAPKRKSLDLDDIGLQWLDITYESDVPKMRSLIEGHAGE
jgi:dTDP-glucose pyrophosphorylase